VITNENLPHLSCRSELIPLGTGAVSFKRVLGGGSPIVEDNGSPRAPAAGSSLVAEPKEGKDIPVGIGDLEAPQAIIDE